MNLISFSIKTKGLHNFARRLWTVFARFGFSEEKMQHALLTIMDSLRRHNGSPTFFVPAIVLQRHPTLINKISKDGAEIGIHGYVHNDYRHLNKEEQLEQTKQAISIFQNICIPYQGFRNPYLGWTEESLDVFSTLQFGYESNEAILHHVVELEHFSPTIRNGYEKSMKLYRVLPANEYTLRPHFEGSLLRIPTSVPDDEMLFDRLRITNGQEVGHIWSKVLQRVYDYGGLYVLNLHPERGIVCQQSLDTLLDYAQNHSLPVWLTRLDDIALWWKERTQFRWKITPVTYDCWEVEAHCTPRATLLARNMIVDHQDVSSWSETDRRVNNHRFLVEARQCPCIALSLRTPQQVQTFLYEQGYPTIYSTQEEAGMYALYLDMPEGLGECREDQIQKRSALVHRIEHMDAPLLHYGNWPHGYRAALSITGDIDSVTVQDFFLRILEVSEKR